VSFFRSVDDVGFFRFDFDDPQEKHFESIRGLLLRGATVAAVGGDARAVEALSDVVAKDAASVGTVVEVADNEVVCVTAIVNLQHYDPGQNLGVDAARKVLAASETPGLSLAARPKKKDAKSYALLVRGKMVNVPPRVAAAAYRCLQKDVANLGFAGFVVVVKRGTADATAKKTKRPPKKRAATAAKLECDDFDDDCFAARATEVLPLGATQRITKKNNDTTNGLLSSPPFAALYLSPADFAAAIDDISRLAEL